MSKNCNPVDPGSITDEQRQAGVAIHEAFEAKSSFYITVPSPGGMGILVDQGIVDGIVNLYVICGSDGVLEYMLTRDGGPEGFIQLPVVKGQTVEGNFKRFGPNTTVYPLVAYANG